MIDLRLQKTRNEVALLLGISPSRVSQITKGLGIQPTIISGIAFYATADVKKMRARNTKPGPKGNSDAKRKS